MNRAESVSAEDLLAVSAGDIVIPPEVFSTARDTIGTFFQPISGVEPTTAARDFLDTKKSRKRAEILERYASLAGKKVLEIGSGFGTNIVAWSVTHGIDGYGVEPSSEGFDAGFRSSRILMAANGLDPARISNGVGESLPFADGSFDIVYSANVLEHTDVPERVLAEAVRVLRPGGTLHVEVPNHLSYFEGHYLVPMPPLVHRAILPLWLRLLRKDPTFAQTLRTQINPIWAARTLRRIAKRYPLDVISFGEDLFLERLSKPFVFEAQGVAGRLAPVIQLLQRINRRNWAGHLIVVLRGFYPLYLTVRRR